MTPRSRSTRRIAFGYTVVAAAWVLLSDLLLMRLELPLRDAGAVALGKGLVFVGVTGLFLYLYLREEATRSSARSARQVEALSRLLMHFRALAERVHEIILLVDDTGTIVEANPAAVQSLGWRREQLVGRPLSEIQVFSPASGTGDIVDYETTFRLPGRELLPVIVDVLALPLGRRQFRQLVARPASVAEASGRKRDRAWLDQFFDLPFIGMGITCPRSKRWLRFNDRLCELLGYSREELAKLTWEQLTHRDDVAADLDHFQRAMAGQLDNYRVEKRFVRKDGATIHVELDVSAVRLADGSVDYFIATVQDVTDRKLAEAAAERQRDLRAALSAINHCITRLPSRAELFQAICNIAVERARFRFAWIAIVDEATRRVRMEAFAGEDGGYVAGVLRAGGTGALAGGTALERAARLGRVIVCDPCERTACVSAWHAVAREAGAVASACLPIRVGNRVTAILQVHADRSAVFDGELIQLLEEMAADVSFALDNLQREEARAASEARYRALFAANPHPTWVCELPGRRVLEVNDAALDAYGYDRETFLRMRLDDLGGEDATDPLGLSGAGQASGGPCRHLRRDGSAILVELAAHPLEFDGRPAELVVASDVTARTEAEFRLRDSEERFRNLAEQSLFGIYVIRGDHFEYVNPRLEEIFGYERGTLAGRRFLDLVHPGDREFIERRVARAVESEPEPARFSFRAIRRDGAEIVVGIHGNTAVLGGRRCVVGVLHDITADVEAQRKIARYTQRLERSMAGTVAAVSRMIELRDPYTAGHERRVGIIARAIGQEMGLDAAACDGLDLAGQVHDIGKITCPSEILSKPGRLSELEYRMVQGHSELGYQILKEIEFDWPIAEIVRQHHERMDGSGYPAGLKGEAIMLEARIIAVADVIEAMASHRPYRPALSVEAALEEICAKSGILYDGEVVAVALRLFRERGFVLPA